LTGSPVFIAAGLASAALIGGLIAYLLRRPSASERERRRRLQVHRGGRITDGTIVDMAESEQPAGPAAQLLYYKYSIGGVEYSACQDITGLTERIGNDPASLVGAVYVKYQSKNPYNSIIICEEWSGLRPRRRA
jgi:hypothetical protein